MLSLLSLPVLVSDRVEAFKEMGSSKQIFFSTVFWLFLMHVLFQDGAMQAKNETASMCAQPALVQQGYRMGGPVSSLTYSLPLQVLQPRSETTSLHWFQSTHIDMHTHKKNQQKTNKQTSEAVIQTLKMVLFVSSADPTSL